MGLLIRAIAILLLIVAIAFAVFLIFYGKNDNSVNIGKDTNRWSCKDNQWIKIGNPTDAMPTIPCTYELEHSQFDENKFKNETLWDK